MPYNNEWRFRIKAVENDYRNLVCILDWFGPIAHKDPTVLPEGLRFSEINEIKKRLNGAYFVKQFAEFETALRKYWELSRDTHPKMRDLLDGIASDRKVPNDHLDDAHRVRTYRNILVHESDEKPEEISLGKAREYLCRFVAFLPSQW
jgi:hypothetical protein